jgi:predicted nucleic acid-binding protein
VTGFVADSSVAVAWALDSQADDGTERLKRSAIEGAQVIVPLVWSVEVANTFLMLFRRRRLTRPEWREIRKEIAAIPVILDGEMHELALHRISDVAEDFTLTAYDAVYLELALRRGLPLASRDGALNKAAKKCGVKTLL